MAEKEMSFEQNITRLEAVVAALENGKAPLAESLSLYEEGMKLIRLCNKQLDEAEQRVRAVSSDGGTVPFDGEGET